MRPMPRPRKTLNKTGPWFTVPLYEDTPLAKDVFKPYVKVPKKEEKSCCTIQ